MIYFYSLRRGTSWPRASSNVRSSRRCLMSTRHGRTPRSRPLVEGTAIGAARVRGMWTGVASHPSFGDAFTTSATESGEAGVLATALEPLLLLLATALEPLLLLLLQLQLLPQELPLVLALLQALLTLAPLALDTGRLTDLGRLTTTPMLAAISSVIPIAAAMWFTTCPLKCNDTISKNQLQFPNIITMTL
jgi:hypothetical protein